MTELIYVFIVVELMLEVCYCASQNEIIEKDGSFFLGEKQYTKDEIRKLINSTSCSGRKHTKYISVKGCLYAPVVSMICPLMVHGSSLKCGPTKFEENTIIALCKENPESERSFKQYKTEVVTGCGPIRS